MSRYKRGPCIVIVVDIIIIMIYYCLFWELLKRLSSLFKILSKSVHYFNMYTKGESFSFHQRTVDFKKLLF